MPMHTVAQGECILSIADQYGFFWKTLWDHAENADLKNLRKDPNVVCEGDEVFIPDKTIRQESCATEAEHKFQRNGIPGKLKVRVMLDNEPIANAAYKLIMGTIIRDGTTDGDGFVNEYIPAGATEAELRVTKDGHENRYFLSLGHLDPVENESGVRQRLQQLGFFSNDDLEGAVRGFQEAHDLEPNGQVDDTLRDKLKEVYGQ